MLKSMTGYGRKTGVFQGIDCSLELRSVNSRFPDITVYVPRPLSFLEIPLRDKLKKTGLRGKLTLTLQINGNGSFYSEFTLDRPLLDSFMKLADELKEKYNLYGELSLYNVMNRQDIVVLAEKTPDEKHLGEFLFGLLDDTLASLQEMQLMEGTHTAEQFRRILESLKTKNDEIRDSYQSKKEAFIERFRDRIQTVLGNDEIDPQLLHHEIVLLGDKLDVSEEIQRFNSHLQQFEHIMNDDAFEVGKKLNFLLQEMNRETTTMGNKINDSEISHMVVDMKNEIEMIREQVQNLQ